MSHPSTSPIPYPHPQHNSTISKTAFPGIKALSKLLASSSGLPDYSRKLSCGDQGYDFTDTPGVIPTASLRCWTHFPPPNQTTLRLPGKLTLVNAKECRGNHLIVVQTIKAAGSCNDVYNHRVQNKTWVGIWELCPWISCSVGRCFL